MILRKNICRLRSIKQVDITVRIFGKFYADQASSRRVDCTIMRKNTRGTIRYYSGDLFSAPRISI